MDVYLRQQVVTFKVREMKEIVVTLTLGFGMILIGFGNEWGLLGLIPALVLTIKADAQNG